MLDTKISKYKVIELIFKTYRIMPQHEEQLPLYFLSVEGIEGLVNENKIPRAVAKIIYKLMTECEENEND